MILSVQFLYVNLQPLWLLPDLAFLVAVCFESARLASALLGRKQSIYDESQIEKSEDQTKPLFSVMCCAGDVSELCWM